MAKTQLILVLCHYCSQDLICFFKYDYNNQDSIQTHNYKN